MVRRLQHRRRSRGRVVINLLWIHRMLLLEIEWHGGRVRRSERMKRRLQQRRRSRGCVLRIGFGRGLPLV